MMMFVMILCMSNLNVIGLKFTKQSTLLNPSKFNLLELLSGQDLSKLDDPKLDKIVEILDHLIGKKTETIKTLKNLTNITKHVLKRKQRIHYDANTAFLRAEDILNRNEVQIAYDDAVKDQNAANETAKEAKLCMDNIITAFNESDLDFEIKSLYDIRSLVAKLLTGTHMPTKSPTLSPTRSPTIVPPVRLTDYPRGRLEVKSTSGWHEVCGNWFSKNNEGAISACKALGYARGGNVTNVEHSMTDPIFVGECLAGELPGFCTGRCCLAENSPDAPDDSCRNQVNCGICKSGDTASIEVQCFGHRRI